MVTSFQSIIKEFINHCIYEKNLSEKTIKAYSIDLAQLNTFIINEGHSTEIKMIDKMIIRQYLENLSSLKPKSIKRKVATLKTMFSYLEFEDKISSNPFRKMKINIHEPQKLPRIMDINEVNKILMTAYNKNNLNKNKNLFSFHESIRNTAVIELLYSTGARVSEIANLKLENINLSSGVITILGKGNKERVIQICNKEVLLLLKKYFSQFKSKIENSGGFFLVNRLGNKISDQSIRGIVKKLTDESKIQKHITPHVFRHTVATLLLENDVDIKYIQSILGHSSIMTTQIYTHVNCEKQKQILKTKHPRRNFSIHLN
jgi:integrase/recombinase XerD